MIRSSASSTTPARKVSRQADRSSRRRQVTTNKGQPVFLVRRDALCVVALLLVVYSGGLSSNARPASPGRSLRQIVERAYASSTVQAATDGRNLDFRWEGREARSSPKPESYPRYGIWSRGFCLGDRRPTQMTPLPRKEFAGRLRRSAVTMQAKK